MYVIFLAYTLPITGITLPSVTITSPKGFIVTAPVQGLRGKKRIRKSKLQITRSHDGHVSFNGSKTGQSELLIESLSTHFFIDNQKHTGSITVRCVHDGIEIDQYPAQTPDVDMHPLPVSEPIVATDQYQVRVLLDAQNSVSSTGWKLRAPGGFIVYDRDDATQKITIASDTLIVRVTPQSMVVNNKRITGECLVIIPALTTKPIGYGDNQYQGVFLVMRTKEKGLLINRVELEDYVFSVLRTESFPGWPLEVNRAFAIACRSYVIAMIMRARKTSLPYHIRNTNHHQTYSGMHECTHLRTAVDDTRGVFLAHKGNAIIAMFDACCGGIIPADVDDFDFIKAPYLARNYPCTFCKRCKIYDWNATYSSEQLVHLLKPEIKRLDTIHDIRIIKRDKAGLIKKVSVKGSKIEATITGKRLYRLLKNVRSFCFSVDKQQGHVIFKGRGYGHHLGICQWGAREMVRDGHDYRSVLTFYYPRTHFVRLQYDRA